MSDKTFLKRVFARNDFKRNGFNRARGLRPLGAAIALSLAAAPVFAQDGTTTPHRFNATVGYAHMVPRSNPGAIVGSTALIDHEPCIAGW